VSWRRSRSDGTRLRYIGIGSGGDALPSILDVLRSEHAYIEIRRSPPIPRQSIQPNFRFGSASTASVESASRALSISSSSRPERTL
jgi:hypothetical protein